MDQSSPRQLSKECIESIEKESDVYSKIPYDKVCFERGSFVALTNPSIYSKAGLISLEDAYDFFNWTIDNKWYMIKKNNWYNPRIDKKEENTLTTAQLFQIYQQQKEK